jgi:rod shape-determining protein MreD
VTARWPRVLLAAVVVCTALVVQLGVLGRLRLPGADPDVVLVVVVAMALSWGPLGGALVGFGAGLLIDVVPPADHSAGRVALTLTLVGYLAGLLQAEATRSALVPLAAVAVAAVAAVLISAAVGTLLGDPRVRWPVVWRGVPAAALYDVVLTPFVLPGVAALCRRL